MRYAALDNAKLILIIFVVFGHSIETVMHQNKLLYGLFNFVYSFHMPAFVVCAGIFFNIKGNLEKTIDMILIPFVIYSIGYEVLFGIASGGLSNYISRLAPTWIMWFLFSLAVWRLVLPSILRFRYPMLVSILLAVMGLSFDLFGYPLGIARTLTFFPFFIAGYIYRDVIIERLIDTERRWLGIFIFLGLGVVVMLVTTDHRLWYGSYNMPDLGYTWLSGIVVKLTTLGVSFVMCCAFFVLTPRGRYIFTPMGENTLYVFLGHGVVIKAFDYLNVFDLSVEYLGEMMFIFITMAFACILTFILSGSWFKSLNEVIFNFVRKYISSKIPL